MGSIPHRHRVCAVIFWVAICVAPWPSPAAEPELVRGPYLQNATQTSIDIRWRTSISSGTSVRYGTNRLALDRFYFRGESATDHSAVLTGLTAGTRYYYAVGYDETTLASGEEYYFRTAPDQHEPIRIWAIGDAGTVAVGDLGARRVRDAYYDYAAGRPTDVWLMLGDNAYFQGTDAQYQVAVFETYPTLLRNTVAWSTVGNHELLSRNAEGHFPYLDIFSPPQQGEAGGVPSGSRLYYSFDHANAHFVCLDSEVLRGTNETMMAWLEQDLSSTTKDWLIAFWHTPPYTKGSHDSDNVFDSSGGLFIMRTNVLPVLESHGVDLVLCGHSHNYERSYLLNGHYGVSTELEPTMILDAGSGRPEDTGAYMKPVEKGSGQGTVYIVNGSSGWTSGSPVRLHPAMYIQVVEIGSVVIDIAGGRLDARFLRDTGAIDDYFTIVKGEAMELPYRITFFRHRVGETDLLGWNSEPGDAYFVQATERLDSPDWIRVSPRILATNFTSYWTNQNLTPSFSNYYRVEKASGTDP